MVIVRVVNQDNGKSKDYVYSYGAKSVLVWKCIESSRKNNNTYVIWERGKEHLKTLVWKGETR